MNVCHEAESKALIFAEIVAEVCSLGVSGFSIVPYGIGSLSVIF